MENLILSSFESKMRRLSPGIKAVLVAPETGDAIAAVCQKHGVETRVFSYAGLVGLILMGELNPNFLVKSIVEKENISVEKAKLIALDLSAAIFQSIKQELVAMYGLTPKAQPQMTRSESSETKPSTLNPIPSVPPPAPSTREAGMSLPEIPGSTMPSTLPPASPSSNSTGSTASEDKNFYSPPPSINPGQTLAGQTKPNVIDLSKELPRPVAQPGDPPLEGNIVNLKNTQSNNNQLPPNFPSV